MLRIIIISVMSVIMLAVVFLAGRHSVSTHRDCTFDGGGTIQSGEIGTTSTGQYFACQDGTLTRIYL